MSDESNTPTLDVQFFESRLEIERIVTAHKVMMALADERVEKAEQECADWKRQFDILLQERSKP